VDKALPVGERVHFAVDCGFYQTLRDRVTAHFEARRDSRRHATLGLRIKAGLILGAYIGVYVALVWFVSSWLLAIGLAMLLGVLAALIGFNIQHDGGHAAYSDRPWQNRLAAATIEMIGASSYLWHWKHAVFHHGFANIAGQDTDISVGRVLRLEPQQERLPHHRWQHLYIWMLYGLMAVRWQLYDDFREGIVGQVGQHRIPRPKGRELAIFIAGKVLFISMALVIPMFFHPIWVVVGLYLLASYTLGFVLSVVFQLAHNTARSDFPVPDPKTGRLEHTWAVHQLLTTTDFSRRSPVVTWLLGGLNYQIEHHLFPHISHVHYPQLSPIVEAVCREHGLPFREHPSFFAGLQAHFAWLRLMGKAPAPVL
jgi:linoleoyl-CoA desaturase